jgi:hypothetical protein
VQREYRGLIRRHMEQLRLACRDSRLDYLMMNTAQPLDEALFNFLSLRQRKS